MSSNLKQALTFDLSEICLENINDDWDGYGAIGITENAQKLANNFISLLPEDIFPPNVVPENSGYISFDWDINKNYYFSVTIEDTEIIYAGIFDNIKVHGKKDFVNKMPKEISDIFTKYLKASSQNILKFLEME